METGEISSRARNAEGYKRANLDVFLADKTFEKELYDQNEELIKDIYQKMHVQTIIDNVSTFLDKLKSFRDKSELAHKLAITLSEKNEDYDNFKVPAYIITAIKWVIEGKVDVQ